MNALLPNPRENSKRKNTTFYSRLERNKIIPKSMESEPEFQGLALATVWPREGYIK